jgi:hypothetical protein
MLERIKTQAEMNDESFHMLQDSERELETVTNKLRYLLYTEEACLFQIACDNFMRFVEHEVEFYAKQNEGGTIYPLVFNIRKKELIDWRIKGIKDIISEREDR